MANSLKTLLKFAYKPNTMRLCGRKEPEIFSLVKKERWSNKEEKRAKKFIKDLKGVYAYISAFEKAKGIGVFSREAIDAYLLGGLDWKGVAQPLKENLKKIALKEKLTEIEKMPQGTPFTHCFHVLYFGAIAIELPRVLDFADKCKVSIGTIEGNIVRYNGLSKELNSEEKTIKFSSPFMEVKEGEKVFLHHGMVFAKANPKKEKIYQNDLQKTLKAVKPLWF